MRAAVIAAFAWCVGVAIGYCLCSAASRRKARTASRDGKQPQKMGVMDRVLVFEAIVMIAYTGAVLAIFWHTGAEPSTLTACIFSVCGLENGVMGWIKTNKDKINTSGDTVPGEQGISAADQEPSGAGQAPPEARPEPPDAGVIIRRYDQ